MLLIQDNRFDATASITVCPLTSDPAEIPLLRIALSPNDFNGITAPTNIMLDKVTTMPRSKLGERIGHVSDTDMIAVSRGLALSHLHAKPRHQPVPAPLRQSLPELQPRCRDSRESKTGAQRRASTVSAGRCPPMSSRGATRSGDLRSCR